MEGNCSTRPARLKGGPNSVASDISTVAYRIYLDFILIWNVFDLALAGDVGFRRREVDE